jgi:hypothetical protein
MACLVLVNVVAAQAIVTAWYPESSARLGPAALVGLTLATLACIGYVIVGWRAYLKRPPHKDGTGGSR